MKQISIKINDRTFFASKPKMKTLKAFLKAKGENENITITYETLADLNEIIKSAFPKVKDKDLDEMGIDDYMDTMEKVAEWIGGSMGGETKN